jgi:ATP-binding cassette subfamily C (CFTR/MRP) protein 1
LITQEPPHEIPDRRPSPHWPEHGAIEFKDVSMSYRPGLPNVLHSLSLEIKGGEKVGVVGRTGAGKSSLALTLLRIVDYSGSIVVDG